jgi:hypothetical protein
MITMITKKNERGIYFVCVHDTMAMLDTTEMERVSGCRPLSVFYAMFDDGDVFYRMHYAKRMLGRARIDMRSKRVIRDEGYVCIGEDPRVLTFRGSKVVIDNFFNDVHIIFPDDDFKRVKVPFDGKNFTFFANDEFIFCATWLAPLTVWRSRDAVVWEPVPCEASSGEVSNDGSFRGGTAGLSIGCDEWIGYGHVTRDDHGSITHMPFPWKLAIRNGRAYIHIQPTMHTSGMRPITDPVCLYRQGDFQKQTLHMVTAESEHPWFQDQAYDCKTYDLTLQGGTGT